MYFSYSSLACNIYIPYLCIWRQSGWGKGFFVTLWFLLYFRSKSIFISEKGERRAWLLFFRLMLYVNETLNPISSFKLFFTPPPGWSNFPTLPRHINKQFLECTFSKSLTHNYANLEEPYNQGIKYKSSLMISKKTGFAWNCQLLMHSVQSPTHNSENLKEPYNQGIKVQVSNKDIEKKTGFAWHLQPLSNLQRMFLKFNPLFVMLTFEII